MKLSHSPSLVVLLFLALSHLVVFSADSSKTIIADLHKKADDLIAKGNWVPAIDIFDEILMIKPDDQRAWHNRG